jgi:hypothetical protein
VYVRQHLRHVALSGGHVAEPRHAELDAQGTAERGQRHSQRDEEAQRPQSSVGQRLQHSPQCILGKVSGSVSTGRAVGGTFRYPLVGIC